MDVSNPRAPVEISSYSSLPDAEDVYVLDNYIFVAANENGGFSILKITYPIITVTIPQQKRDLATGGFISNQVENTWEYRWICRHRSISKRYL
jgi:hypothetical protein